MPRSRDPAKAWGPSERIVTHAANDKYRDNWDAVFGTKDEPEGEEGDDGCEDSGDTSSG